MSKIPKTAYDLLKETSEEGDLSDSRLAKLISDQLTNPETGGSLIFDGPEKDVYQYVNTTVDGRVLFKRLHEGSTISYSFKELRMLRCARQQNLN